MPIRIEAAGRTHIGLVRRRNEDAYLVGQSLFAVADGLGGHIGGDVASTTVIEALQAHDQLVDPADLAAALGRAVSAAHEALRRRIETQPDLLGMGSTLVAMLCSGTSAVLANVGDSRAYLLRHANPRNGRAAQLTEDHTYEHLVADAAAVPHLAARLSRWLDGRADGRSPDLNTCELRPADRFLLCSDGLSSFVTLDRIEATLNSLDAAEDVADRLVTLAIDHGAPDNVTVIVIDVRGAP